MNSSNTFLLVHLFYWHLTFRLKQHIELTCASSENGTKGNLLDLHFSNKWKLCSKRLKIKRKIDNFQWIQRLNCVCLWIFNKIWARFDSGKYLVRFLCFIWFWRMWQWRFNGIDAFMCITVNVWCCTVYLTHRSNQLEKLKGIC